MDERSVAPRATSTPEQILLDRLEAEIDRLREKRPHLEKRLDRAANILVVYLDCPRSRVVWNRSWVRHECVIL